ncbi:MAG: xanthine dehydrogenase family protein molybdopterin-binding subunit [Elusimicrobiota bacterium]
MSSKNSQKTFKTEKITKGFATVSKGLPRIDAEDKVKGKPLFGDDYRMPGTLYARQVYSEHPHARIKSIDISRAKKSPGVKAVITRKDIPGKYVYGNVIEDQRAIAVDKVRFLGDVVAVVAAGSKREALKAADKVEVEYEELPGVFDPREAKKEDAPLVHEDRDSNIQIPQKVRNGDIKKGFQEADVIIEGKFSTPFVEHSYIEPESAIAFIDNQGTIRIKGSFQNPFTAREAVSGFLDVGLEKVRIQKSTLGGSFGGKDELMSAIACRLALLALKTGQPVKTTYSREDSFKESHKRNPFYMDYKVGAKEDGTLTAVKNYIVADSGVYCSMSPYVVLRGLVQGAGPYRVPHYHADGISVYTNNPYTGAMRGFGSPQSHFAMESLMDVLAKKLDMDPLELRLKNVLKKGDKAPTGQKIEHEVGAAEALRKAADSVNWKEKRKQYDRDQEGPYKKGVGIACCMRGVSLGAEGVDAAAASVSVQADGRVIVTTGITDHGQGSGMTMSQIAADVLGISIDRITYIEPDTSLIPDSGPTVASRGTIMGGNATKNAAAKVKKKMLKIAGVILEAPPKRVRVRNGKFYDKSNPDIDVDFDSVVSECNDQAIPLFNYGWYSAPKIHWDEEEGKGEPYFTYSYSANAAEVTVDTKTGKVKVNKFASAHDMGRAINPMSALGQMYGGAAMGIGFAFLEELEVVKGDIKNKNFDGYTLPTSCDVPEFKGHIVERPDPDGPYGAKSLGEPTTEIAAPALINALTQALKRRIYNLPASLERVLLGKKLSKYED